MWLFRYSFVCFRSGFSGMGEGRDISNFLNILGGNMNAGTLFAGLLFGSIGMAYMVYGKKQQKFIIILSGLGLCIIPYFVSNLLFLYLIGTAVTALPFIFRK